VLAVRGDHPVVLVERGRGADLRALLSGQRRIRPHPPLPLEAHGATVEVPRQPHVPVHLDERLVVEVRHVADDLAALVENADRIVVRSVEHAHGRTHLFIHEGFDARVLWFS